MTETETTGEAKAFAFGSVIAPEPVQIHNLGMLSLRKQRGETGPIRLRCTNPQCQREVEVDPADPAFDPTCDNLKDRKLEVQSPFSWRCSKGGDFNGCNGLRAIIS